MAKVYLVTLSLELEDGAPEPSEDEIAVIALNAISGLQGIGNICLQRLPYDSLDDDPTNQILH